MAERTISVVIVTYQAYQDVFHRLKEFFRPGAKERHPEDEPPRVSRYDWRDIALGDIEALMNPDRVEPWDFLAG
jgi:hypothetical protein